MPRNRAGTVSPAHCKPVGDADRPTSAGDDASSDNASRTSTHSGRTKRLVHEIAVVEHHAAGVGHSDDDPRGAGAEAVSGFAMNARSLAALVIGGVLLAAAGCTAVSPNAPTYGFGTVNANTARRGSPEFCRRYAEQTYINSFETASDFQVAAGAEGPARASGDAAYRRCLSGRTN